MNRREFVTIELFNGMGSYTGTYTIEGDKVSHHVDVSWDEAWTGTTQVRQFKIEGNSLRIRAEGLEDGRPSSSKHDMYHRGQLATLMRQLGRKAIAQHVTKRFQ